MRIAMLGGRGVPAHYSGSETCVEEVGARLVQRGHEVVVYCRQHNSQTGAHDYKGMRRVVLPSLNTKHLDTPSHTLFSLLHNFARRPVDVLHFHGVGNSIFLPWLKVMPGKTVITVDGPDWERPKWGRFARRVLKASARLAVGLADSIITDSMVSQQYYWEQFGKKTEYIPYGADITEAPTSDALAHYGLSRRCYILFVGRLVPDKGVHLLVEAFGGLHTDLNLVIVGDSPLFPEYVQRLKSTCDSRIKFLGFVFGEPYRQLCANAFAYVQPSLVEGTSPALLAAMGAGNCVVVNGIPENLETIGDAGLAFTRNDPADLRRILQMLIDFPGAVDVYRARARQRVMDVYNWDTIALQHERVYRSLLTSEGRAARRATS
jgi:glycosyltransferase involved in cell wall biosynthesis